jgi:FkbM family methyltransferase
MNEMNANLGKYIRAIKRYIHQGAALLGYEFIRDNNNIKIKKRNYIGGDYLKDIRKILKLYFNGRDVKCCIDGGAHRGETSLSFIDAFSRANIFSFEPEPDNYKMLCENTQVYPRIKPLNLALGETNKIVTFYKNLDSQTGSLLSGAENCTKYVDKVCKMQLSEKINVGMVTLDDWTKNNDILSIDLLKLDLQGYELNALIGANNLLKNNKVAFLLLEVNFVSVYHNQSQLSELYEFVTQRGYRLVSLYPSEFNAMNYHYRCGADMLFVLENIT